MGNITELSQGNLDGLKKQVCECIEHAQAEGYKRGYTKGKNDGHAQGCNTQSEHDKAKIDEAKQEGYNTGYDTGYNEGLENARKYINKLYQYGLNELQNYFDETSIPNIICRTSIADIIASINLYEEKKRVEKEIKVGDEIQFDNEAKGVVISINKGWYRIVNESGFVNSWTRNDIKKTGRNFSAEVGQLLDKLKGGK